MSTSKTNVIDVKIYKIGLLSIIFALLFISPGVLQSQTFTPELDSAYHLLARKDVKNAIPLFENHIKLYPLDTPVWMQLAYIYDSEGNYAKSYRYFSYVARNSKDPKEKASAEVSTAVLKDKMIRYGKRTIDFDVQSYYDSYQKNYITGLQIYYKFKTSDEVYIGPYADIYTDSESSRDNILNDRYIELGVFGRFYAFPSLYLELRVGWVHEFDFDTSRISVSPRVAGGFRIGEGLSFIPENAKKHTGIFADVFGLVSYETKYKNGFAQVGLTESFRYNIKGYSYLDFFTSQSVTLDSRRLDYNNILVIGTGLKYKPNVQFFPYFFVQPNYKFYLIKDALGNKRTGTFQINAGISFGLTIKG